MAEGASWTNPEDKFPVVAGKIQWRDDGRTCVLPVTLSPNQTYVTSLNDAWRTNFTSAVGVPMLPQRYTFKTKSN